MKKLRGRVFTAVLAALMLVTVMPGTALYASAEPESVSGNTVGQAGTEEAEETGDGDIEKPETDDAEETGDDDTEEPGTDATKETGDDDMEELTQEPPNDTQQENTDLSSCKEEEREDQEGTGTMVNGERNVTGAVAMAEKDGNIIGYYDVSSLADAFAESGNAGATFTLLENVELNDFLEIQIDCTLDLNGHNIHNTSVYGLSTKNGTTVTIRGQGRVISDQHRGLFVGGTVTLEGGTFIGAGFYSGVSVSDSGVLNVTGKDVVIEVSGGGCGLELNYTASAQLSAGTYKGVKAIQITNSNRTLADLLGTNGNYAYYGEDGKPIARSELADQKELTGTVTVQECQHKDVTPTSNNDGTHTLSCPYCGYTKTAEDCDYGEYTHNDTSHTRICKLCGYQNVEVHNIKCTAEASGTVIAVSEACKTCGYGKDLGTVTIHIPKLVYGDLTGVVTAENTLTEPVAVAGNVKNPLGETIIFSDHVIIDPPTMATLTGNALLSAGEHKIKINIVIIRDENALAECELTFNVDPAPLTADMVTLDQTTFTYNGTEQKPALSVKQGQTALTEGTDYEVSYTRGGAATTDLTSAGTITVAVTGKGNYGGTVKKTFTIEKASLTIKANDQTITYGESIGNETERVTVTGLCGSDTLTDITLTPSTENVPGGTIMPSAAKIQNSSSGDASANYDITYKQGTLTINKAQNPPRMPPAVMGNVSKSCQKVSDVPLPDGWVWQDADKEKALEVGAPVSAMAVYIGADKGNYETLTAPVQITRSDCDHTESEILYTGDGESEPTCTKAGLGHTVCTRCGAVVREYVTVPALGHDYDAGEVTKEPTLEDEGERKYTCKRCGHTYTETIPGKEPQGLWIDHMQPSMNYTGAAVRQEQIEVYYGSTLLREKVDYTISYKNNSKAGTAQIIVTGKGNYTGKATENFEIRPIDVGEQPGMTAIVATAVETGKNLKPAVTVTWNGKKLKEKTDYTLSYSTSIKTAGAYEVTVSGKGNYTGSMVKAFVVKPRGTKLLKSAAVSGIKKSYPYPGSGLAADLQGVVVKMGKTTLVKGTDYTVRTENTDAAGTGTIIIEAAQTDIYAGEKRIAVSITGTDLKKGSIKGVEKSYPYTGMPITPQITVYSGRSGKGEVIPADKYTVSYTNNTEKGKATVTATGIPEKGYSGSIKVTYQIGGLNLAAEKAAGNLKVTMPADISHAKGGAKPQPVITYTYEGVTRTLREGADYTLRYSNHTTATGSKPPTVKITGKGNYSGSITETFVIAKQDIGRLSITVTDRAYGKTRKGSYYYSAPKVYDLDGNQLKSGRDYTVQYTYADSGNPIGKNDKIEAGTKLCAVVAAHEKSSYTGTLRATYVVREAKAVKDIGKVKNDKIENQPYTGSAIMPEVRLYTQTGKIKTYLTEEDYEVIGCYNNSRRGTATILVRGKGAYSGVKRVTFKIVQKKIR